MSSARETAARRTISERLADHVTGLRFEDLPAAVVDKAKELLVYSLGTAFRGHALEGGQRAVRVAHDLSGAAGAYAIVGERRRADLLDAVFGNSSLMQCSGLQDYSPPGVNAGVIVHPIAWSIGETSHTHGRELLTALVAGYDVMATLLGDVWGWDAEVNRPPKSVLGPFGGAAVAARLLGLSAEQTTDAFGHAGQASMGMFEGHSHRWIVYPWLARNGVVAATLARAGFPGSPTIVEGTHGVFRTYFNGQTREPTDAQMAKLGQKFAVLDVERRRYPTSILNHIPIDLTQRLIRQYDVTPGRLATVDVILPEERKQRESFYGATPASLVRLVALVLTGVEVTDPVQWNNASHSALETVLDRIRLQFEPGHERRYARIEITTTDGHTVVAAGYSADPAPPLDWADWLHVGRAVVGHNHVTRLAELIHRLEHLPDVAELVACVVPEA